MNDSANYGTNQTMQKIEMMSDCFFKRLFSYKNPTPRMGTSKEGQITKRDVFEMAGVIPTKWLDNLFEVVNKNSFENLQNFVDKMFCEGFSGAQLICQVAKQSFNFC